MVCRSCASHAKSCGCNKGVLEWSTHRRNVPKRKWHAGERTRAQCCKVVRDSLSARAHSNPHNLVEVLGQQRRVNTPKIVTVRIVCTLDNMTTIYAVIYFMHSCAANYPANRPRPAGGCRSYAFRLAYAIYMDAVATLHMLMIGEAYAPCALLYALQSSPVT